MILRALVPLAALAGPAAAQLQPVYDFVHSPQPATGARFGTSTAVLDWDGDGHLDLAIGAPGEGRVYLMLSDGHPTQPTYTFAPPALEAPAPQLGDEFGFDVHPGEFDGDAAAELVVGAPGTSVDGVFECGAAYVFGVAGAPLAFAAPIVEDGRFGHSVAAGDLDGDGHQDVVSTAPHARLVGVPAGAVHIFYGPFGGGAIRLRSFVNPQGPTLWGSYGGEVLIEDIGGDGRADMVVSAIGNTSAGIIAAGQVFAHLGPLPQLGTKPMHLLKPVLLEDEWPTILDDPGPRFGMSIAARAGVVAVGSNRKDWADMKDVGLGFLYRGASLYEPPVRVLRPPPTELDLLGIDGVMVDLVGDATPEVVFSSLSFFKPLALLVWDANAPGLPLELPAPPNAGDHFANGLSWGQLVPGGHEELVIGDGTFIDPQLGEYAGRVAILLGLQ